MKNSIRLDRSQRQQKYYYIASIIVIVILAFLFTFPLYWIITGAFKTKKEIMATEPVWFPSEWTMKNFENLMDKRSAPLFDFTIPALKIEAFGYVFKLGETLKITGPTVPAALRWLVNTVFMSYTFSMGRPPCIQNTARFSLSSYFTVRSSVPRTEQCVVQRKNQYQFFERGTAPKPNRLLPYFYYTTALRTEQSFLFHLSWCWSGMGIF